MSTPYIGYGNDTLGRQPKLQSSDKIQCPKCGGEHVVEDGTTAGVLLFYKCGDSSYLAGVNGRSIMGTRADVRGKI